MTLAEVLSYRHLETEEAGGVSRFITGQHGARMWGPKHAHLTYVDVNGWLIMMPCALDDHGRWYPMGRVVRVNVSGQVEVYPIGPDFELSAMMTLHLEAAGRRS